MSDQPRPLPTLPRLIPLGYQTQQPQRRFTRPLMRRKSIVELAEAAFKTKAEPENSEKQ